MGDLSTISRCGVWQAAAAAVSVTPCMHDDFKLLHHLSFMLCCKS